MAEEASSVQNLEDAPVKTAKQLEKEAKKQAKLDKFNAKKKAEKDEKAAAIPSATDKEPKKSKKPKSTAEEIIEDNTPPGMKKNLRTMPNAYNPKYVESAWYEWWEKEGFFKPEYKRDYDKPNPKGQFVMVIPPPNVTGSLHLGHALTNSIEDAITRWHRMKGKTVLWVPGCDHAGIATQVVVEKMLERQEGKTRHELGREAFTKKVWEWKDKKGSRIYDQLKRLGSSVDWDRACFTMDQKMCNAVTEAFVRLHKKGLIYRSKRLVNWSCSLKSAISDLEVEKVEVTGRTLFSVPGYTEQVEFGVIVSFAYQLDGGSGEIVVATTRVETMLGDTAVAVHPKDERYRHLIGKYISHPFLDRKIPIVADEMVDINFGTGAVKITPGHDQNDFEVGIRNKLDLITIFDDNGILTDNCGKFSGMKRFDARKAVMIALEELKLLRDVKDNPMFVPICSRSKDVVEPILKPQWYVKCEGMASKASQAVKNGDLKIIPDMHKKTWFQWMENIRDWCISRQLWWGHRIPAYFVTITGQPVGDKDDDKFWVSGRTMEEAKRSAADKFKVTEDSISLTQDEDVLDTWFSSALFPFSVFGWPQKTKDLELFYPGTLLETGHDIIFFWVARMVFFAQELTETLPFREVYLHAMVRDAHGRKMSKSLGNVIDPIDVIDGITLEKLHSMLEDSNLHPREIEKAKKGQREEYPEGIPECGTDALRFTLCDYTQQGRDMNLDVQRVHAKRKFCNKLWNLTKFAMKYLDEYESFKPEPLSSLKPSHLSFKDRWILSRISNVVRLCNEGFEKYDFSLATKSIQVFFQEELSDVYIECLKPLFQGKLISDAAKVSCQVLYTCLDVGFRLIAPFMPYVSEELYQRLPRRDTSDPPSLCVTPYPEESEYTWDDPELESGFDQVKKIYETIRKSRATYQLQKGLKIKVYVKASREIEDLISKWKDVLMTLAYCEDVIVNQPPPEGCLFLTVSDMCECHIPLQGIIDLAKETSRMDSEIKDLTARIESLNKKMGAPAYLTKVPLRVRQEEAEKMKQYQSELTLKETALQALPKLT
ncbi:valine--tRNA ligase-like isoform X2 [Artemia franciscana]|uniref:Valine--tRNA ligase n=1 Tax=Artemia franciscana TaxID=6661 RepID=A0AA88I649_ARTSF|nr:hypothetical protein QYM36_002558 [Artemia franciscana]KAK2722042.1 hypothetical protein QYM36_002558 [Artemia franciscana]KAK2722044.1 hypothetical protein QYM36_002558 [Artemia franciscana]